MKQIKERAILEFNVDSMFVSYDKGCNVYFVVRIIGTLARNFS